MKITLPLQHTQYGGHRDCAQAELVNVAPHLTVATFAVGRNPYDLSGNGWRCWNVETGLAIGTGVVDAPTRNQCIARARDYLAKKTSRQVWLAYRKAPAYCTAAA